MTKKAKNTQWRMDILFNKWCLENETVPCKKKKKNPKVLSHIISKITKWIKDLNVRPETIIHLEESRGITLFNISLSNVFLDRNPQKR